MYIYNLLLTNVGACNGDGGNFIKSCLSGNNPEDIGSALVEVGTPICVT